MLKKIKERSAVFIAGAGRISKDLEVFYNPVMQFNRDMSVLLLQAIDKKDMQIGLPMEASGVRGIRFFKELDKNKIKKVYFNDYSESAVKCMKKNIGFNNIKSKFEITKKDANLFMLESQGFDYIDIDPFGCPNLFLDSAVKRLARDGILAVTATDTSALCGTYVNPCLRKYWAVPLHSAEMYEVGLRILIRKVQLIAAQYDKALIPVFCYSKDHYMRVFFRCEKGKKYVDEIISQFGTYKSAGPLWLGQLHDKSLVNKMCRLNIYGENKKFLDTIKDEMDIVGFYDTHDFCKNNGLDIPKKEVLIQVLKKNGFSVSLTHFSETAIKSDVKEKDLVKIIKSLS